MIAQENIPYTADEIDAMVKTIEELRKKYNTALERAENIYNSDFKPDEAAVLAKYLPKIFPELKMSEEERIKKALIKILNEIVINTNYKELGIDYNIRDMIAWLEKQGENKPTDKVEPKFKVGDWIIFNGLVLHIDEVVNGYYRTTSIGDGIHNSYDWDIDNAARLWTIQEAKDGDVLTTDNFIFIFKSIDNSNGVHYYCHYEISKREDDGPRFGIALPQSLMGIVGGSFTHYKPATKEQRDLFFQKMKEAGYEWDTENKQLKKISQRMISAETKEAMYDKPTDEEMIETLRTEYEKGRADAIAEMQKDWSEEDEYILLHTINDLKFLKDTISIDPNYTVNIIDMERKINWLKSLRPQNNITDEELAQAKKDAYNDALDKIEYHSGEPTFDDGWSAAIWYLKKKNAMPHQGLAEPQFEFHPATKEQCDTLFAKMKEAGYGWNNERKELKKIEQNPADKSKFKVGDWFVNNNRKDVFLIKSIDANGYCTLEDIKGNIISPCLPPCESDSHLWTIENAKDGDVLTTDNFIFIFKSIDNSNGVHYYCQYEISKHEDDNQFDIALPQSLMGRVGNSISHYSPATKEQRDLLFEKMKNAGYEWDSEKKELKTIETNTLNADKVVKWLNDQACLGWLEDIEVEKVVEQFKKDFGL